MQLVALEFKTSHPRMHKQGTGASSNDLANIGIELSPPHWKAGESRNHPASFTRKQFVEVELTLNVESSTANIIIEGKSNGKYLNFKAQIPPKAAGQMRLTMKSTTALPDRVTRFAESITWSTAEGISRRLITKTGPHEIFVLWDKPIVQSSFFKMSNALTYERLCLLTGQSLAGGKNDMNTIAHAIQTYVNRNASKGRPDIHYANGGDGNQFWALLNARNHGQCGEFSFLMELMNRLLGIPAMQKHVKPATTLGDIDRRLSYDGHVSGPEKRTCARHGEEMLELTFGYKRNNTPRYSINEGEGTCDVNHRLYAGIISYVGVASGGKSAAHSILRACEREYAPNLQNSKQTGHSQFDDDRFIVWVTKADENGEYGVCEISKQSQLAEASQEHISIPAAQADPFPAVPS